MTHRATAPSATTTPGHASAAGGATPATPATPAIRRLGRTRCRQILARNRVGRLAFGLQSRIDIEPLLYVLHEGWIFFRTSSGSKTRLLRQSPWAAFEVDEVEGPFEWRSVVVHGTIYDDTLGDPSAHGWKVADRLLRESVPGTGTRSDPAPYRTVVLGLRIDTVMGREATPGPDLAPELADAPRRPSAAGKPSRAAAKHDTGHQQRADRPEHAGQPT